MEDDLIRIWSYKYNVIIKLITKEAMFWEKSKVKLHSDEPNQIKPTIIYKTYMCGAIWVFRSIDAIFKGLTNLGWI